MNPITLHLHLKMKLIKYSLIFLVVVVSSSISTFTFSHVTPEDELRNQVYLNTRQALQKVFAGTLKIKKVKQTLSASQQVQVQKILKQKFEDPRIEFFTASKDDRKLFASIGKVFANSHPVTQARFVVLMDTQGRLQECHIMEYKGPQRAELISPEFLDQFKGKSAESDFSTITSNQGNTPSVQALSQGVLKILALYKVLYLNAES